MCAHKHTSRYKHPGRELKSMLLGVVQEGIKGQPTGCGSQGGVQEAQGNALHQPGGEERNQEEVCPGWNHRGKFEKRYSSILLSLLFPFFSSSHINNQYSIKYGITVFREVGIVVVLSTQLTLHLKIWWNPISPVRDLIWILVQKLGYIHFEILLS